MKNTLPILMKVNIWDFININKLNEYTDDFLGEVVENLTYHVESISASGDIIFEVNSQS